MNYSNIQSSALTLTCVLLLTAVSCTSEKKPDGTGPSTEQTTDQPADQTTGRSTTRVAVQTGVAGGVVEESFAVSATVQAVDKSTREVTLSDESGEKGSFKAGPEVKNFDQIRVGDKVNATLTERLAVFVRSDGADPSVTHAAALAAAPKGAKPGAMVAQSYELIASVTSIDTAKRTATLKFSDGQTRTVSVRPDVDMSQYKVGDSVVIRITQSLKVLVEKP